MCATSAFAQQYGSEYRKEYEKEVNGPHGECTTKWDHIASGIDYRKITCLGDEDDVDVHAFKISQEFFKLDVAYVTNGSSAKSEAGKREARFVMNANFFQRDKTPIGVIVRSGTQLQPAQSSSWQSVFLIDADGKPRIVTVSQWSRYKKGAQMAVQAGPRTVVAEHTNQINKGYAAARCGVCIQRNGDIVFFATPQERKFKAHEIARVTRRSEVDGGLRCRDAMLFDGGHSTQFFVEGDDRKFSQSGDPVPVFVFATRK
jgi:uncharacterized protein YigE (DUF2233 family)